MTQKIIPCLWFDNNCEEAINFYIDIFNSSPGSKKNSKIISIIRYQKGMEAPGTEELLGKILTAVFELDGQRFIALDGGPIFKFNESVSFTVECATQEEIDYFWKSLSFVPESEQCGWLKDKFGLSWQVVPRKLGELIEKDKSNRVINALLEMKKLVIEDLEKAFFGKGLKD